MCVQQEFHAYIQVFMVQALSWARGCIPTLNVHVLWRADTFPTTHGVCTVTGSYIHPSMYCGALMANTQH